MPTQFRLLASVPTTLILAVGEKLFTAGIQNAGREGSWRRCRNELVTGVSWSRPKKNSHEVGFSFTLSVD